METQNSHNFEPLEQFFQANPFCIPMEQVILLVLLTSACLLFRKDRLGLMVSYLFVLYWGFSFNREYLINALEESSTGLMTYMILGVGMACLTIFGFYQDAKKSQFVIDKLYKAGEYD